MIVTHDRRGNQTAYHGLKDSINQRYARGRYVAIHRGRVAADAGTFPELIAALKASGIDSKESLIVQAGVDYPEKGVILNTEHVHDN